MGFECGKCQQQLMETTNIWVQWNIRQIKNSSSTPFLYFIYHYFHFLVYKSHIYGLFTPVNLGQFWIKQRMRIFPRHQAPLIFQRLIKLDFLWKFMILEKTKRNLEKDFRAHTCSMKKLKLRTEWFDYSLILCITNTRIVLRLLIWISFFLHESLLTQLYRDL